MSMINCSCGNQVYYNEILNPNEYLYISDIEYNGFKHSIDPEKLYNDLKHFVKCNKCNKIYLFERGLNEPPLEYELKE